MRIWVLIAALWIAELVGLDTQHTVHRVGNFQAKPVDGERFGQMILEHYPQTISLVCLDRWTRARTVESPTIDRFPKAAIHHPYWRRCDHTAQKSTAGAHNPPLKATANVMVEQIMACGSPNVYWIESAVRSFTRISN
jgi:hypothetical protein